VLYSKGRVSSAEISPVSPPRNIQADEARKRVRIAWISETAEDLSPPLVSAFRSRIAAISASKRGDDNPVGDPLRNSGAASLELSSNEGEKYPWHAKISRGKSHERNRFRAKSRKRAPLGPRGRNRQVSRGEGKG